MSASQVASGRLHQLAIAGRARSGKTEAALAYALMAARRGPVLFLCDNQGTAKMHRRSVHMESGPTPIVFFGLGQFRLLSSFAEPFPTIVVDTALSAEAKRAVLEYAARAASLHRQAWLVATQDMPTL